MKDTEHWPTASRCLPQNEPVSTVGVWEATRPPENQTLTVLMTQEAKRLLWSPHLTRTCSLANSVSDFCSYYQRKMNMTPCPSQGFCCCEQHHDQQCPAKKRICVFLRMIVPHWGMPGQEPRFRAWSKSHEGTLFTGLLPVACSACSFTAPRTASPEPPAQDRQPSSGRILLTVVIFHLYFNK